MGRVVDRPGRHRRVVGGVHVHDVEAALAEEAPPAAGPARGRRCASSAALLPQPGTYSGRRRPSSTTRRWARARPSRRLHRRRPEQVAGDDGDLVAERWRASRLPVDVLGDAPERRVVEVGDDRDPHRARDAIGGLALSPRVCQCRRGARYTRLPCRSTSTDARTSTGSRCCRGSRTTRIDGVRGVRCSGPAGAAPGRDPLQGVGLLLDRLRRAARRPAASARRPSERLRLRVATPSRPSRCSADQEGRRAASARPRPSGARSVILRS